MEVLIEPPPITIQCGELYFCDPAPTTPAPGSPPYRSDHKGRALLTFVVPDTYWVEMDPFNPKIRQPVKFANQQRVHIDVAASSKTQAREAGELRLRPGDRAAGEIAARRLRVAGIDGYARRPVSTCVVTGGAGFLGSHLCEYLLGRGHRVICIDNLDTGSLENIEHIRDENFVFSNHDITEFVEVEEPVDFVYHLASPASPIDYARLPLHTLKVGSLRAPTTCSGWRSSSGRASCSPRPRRSTATPRSIPSPRTTGATSTRSARAASTTRRSATPRR